MAESLPLPNDLQATSPNGAQLVGWVAVYEEGYVRLHGSRQKIIKGLSELAEMEARFSRG